MGVLVVCGLLLGFVEGKSTELLYRLFGWGGVLFTGVAGTPIHELGHYLMCRLFGVRVTEVALFRPVAGRADGVLGMSGTPMTREASGSDWAVFLWALPPWCWAWPPFS